MLKVKVQLVNGQEHTVKTPLSVEQFDDKIMFASKTDFLIDVNGNRIQISKILTHKPIEEISNG